MNSTKPILYGSEKITKLVLYSSLGVSFVLTLLLVIYDVFYEHTPRLRTIYGASVILFLCYCAYLVRKNHVRIVSWLLVILYTAIAYATLLYWGLDAAVGIFASSFAIILSGTLLGSKAILPTALTTSLTLIVIQFIHTQNIITPQSQRSDSYLTMLDAISYIVIIGVFSLLIWVSNRQIERTLSRLKHAEAKLRLQKNNIALKLEQQSSDLRQAQLSEMQQLYKFAALGQSTAATLHELSNHLSVLNMDIDDMKQHSRNSKAINNAQESIEQINLMVRHIRRTMETSQGRKKFRVHTVIQTVLKDQAEKFQSNRVTLHYQPPTNTSLKVRGDSLALAQVITILVVNALDASLASSHATVKVTLTQQKQSAVISVTDNGIGLSETVRLHLFSPVTSTKPSGLGVGLYIAKHIIESQFHGAISFRALPSKNPGAQFIIKLPLQQDK